MSKPRFYAVRPGFWLHGVSKEPRGPGSVVELTDDQAETYAHQIEPAPKGKRPGDQVSYDGVPAEVASEPVVEPVVEPDEAVADDAVADDDQNPAE